MSHDSLAIKDLLPRNCTQCNDCLPCPALLHRFLVFGKHQMERTWSSGRPLSGQEDSSLTAVMYGMVQVRKKQSLGSSLSVPTSRGGRGGRLSVTFSLRRKSKKPNHKLQRIASENPNTQNRKLASGSMLQTSSSSNLDEGPASHSSPDVRRQGTPDNTSTTSPIFEFNSETRVDIE